MKLNQWQIIGILIIVVALAVYGWRQYGNRGGTPVPTNTVGK